MHLKRLIVAWTIAAVAMSYAESGCTNEAEPTARILERFAASYRTDPMALTVTFGIKVGDDWWHVTSKRFQRPYPVGKEQQYTFHEFGPHEVQLNAGPPATPTWYFELAERSTLDNIDQKIWTASTAAAKSTPADKTHLELREMDGFVPSQQSTAITYQVLEHFWKRDIAEITRFSRDGSLPSHGAELVALYTMKDKRIAWFSIGTQEAANAEQGMDKGQVPNLMIFTKGRGKALIGDEAIDVEPGMSIFVAPYVKHVIHNPYDAPLEGIIVLFGDNIDYARGQSYLDFLEAEYAFYRSNEIGIQATD